MLLDQSRPTLDVRRFIHTSVATLAALGLTALLLGGCGSDPEKVTAARTEQEEKQNDIFEERGLTGEFDLMLVDPNSVATPYSESVGEFEGGGFGILIVGGANIEGEQASQSGVKVQEGVRLSWRANDEQGTITTSTFPLDIVRVVEIPEDDEPKLVLETDPEVFIRCGHPLGEEDCNDSSNWEDPFDSSNLNDFFRQEGYVVTVNLHLPPSAAQAFYTQLSSLDPTPVG